MNVDNKKCIQRLSMRSLKAAKTRNIIAVLSIALTALLFTSLFTVALSINYSFQQSNFRQAGGWCHGTFKYLTKEQFDKIKTDPLIKEYGLRRIVGLPSKAPFQKSHVEVGYSDANQAHWMYCDPVEGHLPTEGTSEAATDTRVLELLGVKPVLGNEFTMTFDVNGTEVTKTFVLSGWWKYDKIIPANHILIPHSLAQSIYNETGIGDGMSEDGLTGSWNMDIMLDSSLHIERDMEKILENHGYQGEDRAEDNYIGTGVNWGYSGSQLADSMDPVTALGIAGLLLLIIFTGYLIIYNVFQISVSNDIRFYGLLKTIGTTGHQLKRIIRKQAFILSLIGIPLGLLAGYGVGIKLTPVVLSQLNGVVEDAVSVSPLIFIGSALFALMTVMISCHRPGRVAAKVSPVEAVRYTEGKGSKKTTRKAHSGASLSGMARANLGRSLGKTVITMASLALAVLMLNMTVTFTNGFDMDKYLRNMVSDFILADTGYFQTDWYGDNPLPEDVISSLKSKPGVEAGGCVYGQSSSVEEFVTEDYFRTRRVEWNDKATIDHLVDSSEKNKDGLLADQVKLYGMEPFVINKVRVLEGDLSKLYEPGEHYVAAVFMADDYGNPELSPQWVHWAKVGDTVTLRYVEEYEYYDPETGKILDPDKITEDQNYSYRAKTYKDITYKVVAAVMVPNTLTYRHYGSNEFIMNDQTFIQDSGTRNVMYYTCDVNDKSTAHMEQFLSDLTNEQMPQLNYESKSTYAAQFDSFRNMFLLLGGVLSFIIGLVGVLNFINSIMMGILTRRHELAMLQSVGMTGGQLKRMLIWEGLYYTLGAVAVSLLLNTAMAPLLSKGLGSIFWFFTYRFTISPILFITPVFAALGIVTPLMVYRTVSRYSIVERLRETE